MAEHETDLVALAKEALITIKNKLAESEKIVNETINELFPEMEESEFVKKEKEELKLK
jgi:hypothetical protein